MLNLKPHEEAFLVRPVGIRYICEFCNEGEMIAMKDTQSIVIDPDEPRKPPMFKHVCTKCKKTMLLPSTYPRVEFVSIISSNQLIAKAIMIAEEHDTITPRVLVDALNLKIGEVDQIISEMVHAGVLVRENEDSALYDVVKWDGGIPDVITNFMLCEGYSTDDIKQAINKRGE